MKNKPAYAIDSVDHALHLVSLLHTEGPLRVTDAAERLGVSASTAHRLLAMLVYRDFAEQQADRQYCAGFALAATRGERLPVAVVRRVALPHLRWLTAQAGESSNLIVVTGTAARFLATVESPHVLRVGDRSGRSLPAHLTSGGRAVLAARSAASVRNSYDGHNEVDVPGLARVLSRVRKLGFAINDQLTEAGLTAIGMVIDKESSEPSFSVSLALPTARFERDHLPRLVALLAEAARKISNDLSGDL